MRSRKIAVAAAVCLFALPSFARATIRVFVTPASAGYGLTIPSNAFQPTYSIIDPDGTTENALDFTSGAFVCTSFPPQAAPSGTCANPVVVPPDDFAYIWLQYQNEPVGPRFNGIQIAVQPCGPWGAVSVCYYLQNNLDGPPPVDHVRWDVYPTPPDYPELRMNPQTLIAMFDGGIPNLAFDPPPPENWNMYDVQATWGGIATGVALLGAVQAQAGKRYTIDITNISYSTPPPSPIAGGAFYWPCRGDLNCDGQIDFADINPFVLFLTDYNAWLTGYPGCHPLNGDINGDGSYGQGAFGDINPFVALLSAGDLPYLCP